MKTIFTEEEVRDFLLKKGREIQGEAILLPTAAQEMEDVPKSFKEMFNRVYDIGKKEGHVEGKLALMKEFLDFFQVEIDE